MTIQRFFAIIVALFTVLPSYLLSFLPGSYTDDFTIADKSYTLTEVGDSRVCELDDEKTGIFNYFGIKYSTGAYVKGTLTYVSGVDEISEDFFLEPAVNGEFYSLTDGYLEKVKAHKAVKIEFKALNQDETEISLEGLGFFNRRLLSEEIYIENDEHRLGVNLNWGGALSYLEDKNSSVEAVKVNGVTKVDSNASSRYGVKAVSKAVNLINANDTGRLVQQSYYGTGDYEGYTGGVFMDNKWNYNPVQGGNQFNDPAKIVDVKIADDYIYIKCRPMDWAKEKEFITPSYMEATYSLSEGLVKAVCRFVDYSGYPSVTTTQECPAFYCVEPLNRLVYYSGDAPWTGDAALSYENDLIFWPDAGYPHFPVTENWAAFIGEYDDSFGIGLYVPDEASFLAGVFSRGGCTTADPATESPTSYIAAVESYEFRSFNPTSYEFYLSTGTAQEIRDNFSAIAK